uniref:Auxin efflux carrier family protein n=1 Tax=Solanum tuberosum TaxID=4113 RepID=M1ALW5_SOLTU
MGLLDLFITASMPVLKVLLITALGLILALDRIDLLGQDARKHLNNVSIWSISFLNLIYSLFSSLVASCISFQICCCYQNYNSLKL